MARRSLVIVPLPERGHIYPTLEIARHYVTKKFEVIYLTSPQFTQLISSVGARVEPMFPLQPGINELTGQQLWYHFAHEASTGARRRKLEGLLHSFARDHVCELFLIDYHIVTSFQCDVRRALGSVPSILFGTSLLGWNEPNQKVHDHPTMIFCPRYFEVAEFRDRGPTLHHVEPSIYRQDTESASLAEYLTPDNRPLIIGAWGTQSTRYSQLRKLQSLIVSVALRHPELRFQIATGPQENHRIECSLIPSNVTISLWIPQLELLKSASLMMTHGGLNSLKETIINEVPALVFPFVADQPYNALRVERSGVGMALFPEEQTVERIETAILQILSGNYNDALRTMRNRFLSEESLKPSHAVIENHLR